MKKEGDSVEGVVCGCKDWEESMGNFSSQTI